jgi:hypothetical protein
MAAGYDIGASFATSATSGANLNSPFNVTGGGGSISFAYPGANVSGVGSPSKATDYLPLFILGAVLLLGGLMLLALRRK